MKQTIISTTILALLSMPAHALEPLDVNGEFGLYAGQIPIGKMRWIAREKEGEYFSYGKLRTTGIARLISKHRREVKVTGLYSNEGYRPLSYEYNSSTGKKRHVELKYNSAGKLIHRLNEPEDGAGRPQVSALSALGSVDPLSSLLVIREKITKQLETDAPELPITFNIYDGRRLMEGTAQWVGTAKLTDRSDPFPVHKILLKRTPIDGFSAKEIKKFEETPEPPVYLYLSKDERMMPLLVEAEADIITLRARWEN